MGGFDNDTSKEFSNNLKVHQSNFVNKRMKLHQEWMRLGLDKKMTFLQYCKNNKKKKKK